MAARAPPPRKVQPDELPPLGRDAAGLVVRGNRAGPDCGQFRRPRTNPCHLGFGFGVVVGAQGLRAGALAAGAGAHRTKGSRQPDFCRVRLFRLQRRPDRFQLSTISWFPGATALCPRRSASPATPAPAPTRGHHLGRSEVAAARLRQASAR